MSRRAAIRLALGAVALTALAGVAYPPGTTAVIDWVAGHDGIDVPYVRDCRGILRRADECPGATEAGRSSALR